MSGGNVGETGEIARHSHGRKFALDLGAGDLVSYSRLLRGGLRRVADWQARFPAREGR